MIDNRKYRLYWIFRFFLPCVFFGLFFIDVSRHIFLFRQFDLNAFILFLIEGYIFYHMLYFFTVEYQINKDNLVVYSFLFRKKIIYIKDILQIRDEGGYYLFRKIPFGINALILDLKNGRNITIFGLKDHFAFLQDLQLAMSN